MRRSGLRASITNNSGIACSIAISYPSGSIVY
jgi:hypothetical protein